MKKIIFAGALLLCGTPVLAQQAEAPCCGDPAMHMTGDGVPENVVEFCELAEPLRPALGRAGWAEMPAASDDGRTVCFAHDRLPSDSTLRNYTFCFDPQHHCSLWVAYPLHDCYVGESDRTNRFGCDPDFDRSVQADIGKNAYYPQGGGQSSHSRGHQLPSADRTAASEDNLTTFYATNMTPQRQSLNGVKWAELERDVRGWRCCDTLYVVTGAWFDPTRQPQAAYDAKGQGKACPVPSHYYKVLLRSKSGNAGKPLWELSASELQCIGFWFDHEDPAAWNVASCVRTVAQIERLTGFTFFLNVPQAPKETSDPCLWPGIK